MSTDPLDTVSQKFGDFKNNRWQRWPFGKSKNRIALIWIDQFLKKNWLGDVSHSSQPHHHIKFFAFNESS